MHQLSTPAVRPVRLPSPTVPRADYESACAARNVAQGLYARQTLALHQRSVAYLSAVDDNHRLRRLLAAHGIDPEASA